MGPDKTNARKNFPLLPFSFSFYVCFMRKKSDLGDLDLELLDCVIAIL